MLMKDAELAAAMLYDGGWRADEIYQLQDEYDLTDEELEEIAREILNIEESA